MKFVQWNMCQIIFQFFSNSQEESRLNMETTNRKLRDEEVF